MGWTVRLLLPSRLSSRSCAVSRDGCLAALAPHLLEEARHQARWIGIRHQECGTEELRDPSYSSILWTVVMPASANCIAT